MRNILITLLFIFSISLVSAQENRVVRLNETRDDVISSEVIVSEFDGDREVGEVDMSNMDLVTDSDSDGISDFIERNIYFTDVNNSSTLGDSKDDRVKILLGLDPLSEAPLEVKYEDIRKDSSATMLDILSINEVSPINGKVSLKGTGLPNSLTTIYIFDLNLVIFTPTDSEGNWEYVLAKEVADERYDVYLGVLNTDGSVVYKSEKIIFQQEEGEIVLNPEFDMRDIDLFELFLEYFWWILLSVFVFGVLVVGVLIWKNTEINENKRH